MAIAEESININAPADSIFDVVANPAKTPEWMPGVSGVINVQGPPGQQGTSAEYAYSVLGNKFDMNTVVTEVDKPSKLVLQMEGDFPGTFQVSLQPQGQATRVDLKMEYDPPGGLWARGENRVTLIRVTQQNLEEGAEKLRLLCEG